MGGGIDPNSSGSQDDATGRSLTEICGPDGTPITSQVNGTQRALDIGINVAGVQVDPRLVRALTAADVVTANQGSPNTLTNGWPVKITDGISSVLVSTVQELRANDSVNNSFACAVIALTTSPVELKVGGSRLANRKYLWMYAQDNNIVWGCTATQALAIFKSQLFCFPIGNVPVYAKTTTGTGNIAIIEGA